MYTVDCLYLNRAALKLKKKTWEQLEKYSVYMYVMFYLFITWKLSTTLN